MFCSGNPISFIDPWGLYDMQFYNHETGEFEMNKLWAARANILAYDAKVTGDSFTADLFVGISRKDIFDFTDSAIAFGKEHGSMYFSCDNAAAGWADSIYSTSLYIRHEYSGEIFSSTFNGRKVYSYTNPRAGSPHGVKWNKSNIPTGTNLEALIHTHINSDNFSEADKAAGKTYGVNVYLVDTSGKLRRYNVSDGTTTTDIATIKLAPLSPAQKNALEKQFKDSWDNHFNANGECPIGFSGCQKSKWPSF